MTADKVNYQLESMRSVNSLEANNNAKYLEETSKVNFKDAKVLGGSDIGKFGFPHVDLTGFEQEAPYKSSGALDYLWHGVKHLFVKDESVGDKLRKDVEQKMSPEEHKQYDKENKAIEEYNKRVIAWGSQATINPGPFPKAPDCPMHQVIDKRVEATERGLVQSVRDGMSPAERKELDKQFADYQAAYKEATTIHNPWGTGEGFKPLPKPGPAIEDYYRRVNDATDEYMRRH
jgi:hypothetical protein